jgi:hypothetical protein
MFNAHFLFRNAVGRRRVSRVAPRHRFIRTPHTRSLLTSTAISPSMCVSSFLLSNERNLLVRGARDGTLERGGAGGIGPSFPSRCAWTGLSRVGRKRGLTKLSFSQQPSKQTLGRNGPQNCPSCFRACLARVRCPSIR